MIDREHDLEPDAKRCFECDTLLSPLACWPFYCSQQCRDAAGADD